MGNIDKFIESCEDTIALESNNEVETKTFKIKGSPEHLKEIEALLCYISHLGHIGHSTTFKVGVDGDGGARLRITDENNKAILNKKEVLEYLKSRMDSSHDIESFILE